MRKMNFFDAQSRKVSDLKRLRELEQENGLLKSLYVDLLQKSAAVKDGIGVRAHVW